MSMDPSKLSSTLIIIAIFISTTPPTLSCVHCPPSRRITPPKGPIVLPPFTGNPPRSVPPGTGTPPGSIPPGTGNPPTSPPGQTPGTPGTPGKPGTPATPGTPGAGTCPIDALKLGACVDLLGGLVNVVIGDPVVNQCCPLLQGLVELEAAVCLCTTIRLRLLSINVYLPLALQLLITCGLTPPPGFTCPL